jgi:hypothetical protein
MFKVASGEQRMGKAYFLEVLQVRKQRDLCEDTECLAHHIHPWAKEMKVWMEW